MDVAALFRPSVKYEDGVITELQLPENVFHCDPAAKLVFFIGQEPNLRWQAFADCVFDLAERAGVTRILFIGSFGGSVPHTREPRLYGSVSDESLRPCSASTASAPATTKARPVSPPCCSRRPPTTGSRCSASWPKSPGTSKASTP